MIILTDVNILYRFRLYGLCCDDSGTVPIVWPDEEVCRLIGKTVYDVDADETEVKIISHTSQILIIYIFQAIRYMGFNRVRFKAKSRIFCEAWRKRLIVLTSSSQKRIWRKALRSIKHHIFLHHWKSLTTMIQQRIWLSQRNTLRLLM